MCLCVTEIWQRERFYEWHGFELWQIENAFFCIDLTAKANKSRVFLLINWEKSSDLAAWSLPIVTFVIDL